MGPIMAGNWYVRQGQKVFGPFDSARLKQLAAANKITLAMEVSQASAGPWTPAERVRGLFGQSKALPPPETAPNSSDTTQPGVPPDDAAVVGGPDTALPSSLTGVLSKVGEGASPLARIPSDLVASPSMQDKAKSALSASKQLITGLFAKKEKEDGLLESYSVAYKGGHPDYPNEKATSSLNFKVFADRFEFVPTFSSKSWFQGLAIPYDAICHFEIVQRQVGTVEAILGGINSRQLNQPNNIHIEYELGGGRPILIRFEMLTGVTVMGQAKVCTVLLDRLRNLQILDRITRKETPAAQTIVMQPDIPEQIEKLAALREKGILNQGEFEKKKAELLAKM